MTKIVTLDFETFRIEPRPAYPPKPVGLAWEADRKRGYESCRVRSEWLRCGKMIKSWLRDGYVPLFHNASFDLDVAETHLGVAWPSVHHDTLLLAYLFEPRAPSLGLKQLAESVLGDPPTERDELHDWIVANIPTATKKTAGAYIAFAPFELVRSYAIGDVDKTDALFRHYIQLLKADSKMQAAYDRERKLTRVLVKMERRGVPIAVTALSRDLPLWRKQQQDLETKLFTALKVPKKRRTEEFAWAGKNFAEDLLQSGHVAKLPVTLKGNPSTSADNLAPLLPPKLASMLELRAQLQTCIRTFGEPWLRQARQGGRFYARYNQVRGDYHGTGKMIGTTTGRLSMSPNLQNVFRSTHGDLVPKLRKYLVPQKNWYWVKADYSQQEMRLFAHYESGELLERYKRDPTIDIHEVCRVIIKEQSGVALARREVKDISFGVLYGLGFEKMAKKLGMNEHIGRITLKAYHAALPGIKQLQSQLKELAENNEPLYTWGGRKYYCEPPGIVKSGPRKGKVQTYEYKLLNLLVQGGSADLTKEAMIRYDDTSWNEDDKSPLLLQVHDELDMMTAPQYLKEATKVLRTAMESLEVDIPMLADIAASKISWDAVEKVS